MLLDVSSLFAQNISMVDGVPEVIDLGEKGLGRVRGLNLFVEISEEVAGLESASFHLYSADNTAGTENREEILVSPVCSREKLKRGFCYMAELPATVQRYLIFEVKKSGAATAGRYWAGLTGSEQYAAHNV